MSANLDERIQLGLNGILLTDDRHDRKTGRRGLFRLSPAKEKPTRWFPLIHQPQSKVEPILKGNGINAD